MYCNVLVIKPFDHTFTYKIRTDQNIKLGNIVNVPFGNKKDQIGIVYELCENEIKKDNNNAKIYVFSESKSQESFDDFLNFDENSWFFTIGFPIITKISQKPRPHFCAARIDRPFFEAPDL